MQNVLQKLIQNSQKAIDEGVYEIAGKLQKSQMDLIDLIKNSNHAPIITEVKFSSPSLGKIRTTSDSIVIANSMIRGGAIGLSVLTQPYLFDGSPEFFINIRQNVKVPLLMKDIIIDKIQIEAAQRLGADYILLIESLFDNRYLKEIDEYVDYAHKKNLRVLIESHTKTEFKNSLKTNADLIGINNRNLDTLDLDIKTTKIVLDGFDKSRIILSESGIEAPKDIRFLHDCGASAFLVGSSVMKSDNIETFVRQLVNAL